MAAFAQTAFHSSDEQSIDALRLRRMKRVSTALLLLMLALYLVARRFENQTPGLIWLHVFAEAALIGGLADWFAVTALFRHPLGLPIPHTAIIPASKRRIGLGLGSFIQKNFLSAEAVDHRLREMDLSLTIAGWLERPENARRISVQIAHALPELLSALDDRDLQEFFSLNVRALIGRTKAAPFAGKVLELFAADEKYDQLIEGVLALAEVILHDHQQQMGDALFKEAPWYVPLFVHKKVFEGFVRNFDTTVQEVQADPRHPLRTTIRDILRDLITRLQNSPDLLNRGEELKARFLASELPAKYLALVWADVKSRVLADLRSQSPALSYSINSAITSFGENLAKDEVLRGKINQAAVELSLRAISNYSNEVGDFIAATVERWDEFSVSRRIELYVGRDLQFIRINGTLVGGAVGLLLHLFSNLASKY